MPSGVPIFKGYKVFVFGPVYSLYYYTCKSLSGNATQLNRLSCSLSCRSLVGLDTHLEKDKINVTKDDKI